MIYKVSEKEPPFNKFVLAKKGKDGEWNKVKRTYQGDKPEYTYLKDSNGYTHWKEL